MSWWITRFVDGEENEEDEKELMLKLLMKERLELERTSAILLGKIAGLEDEVSYETHLSGTYFMFVSICILFIIVKLFYFKK